MIYVLKGNTIRDIGLPLQQLIIRENGQTTSDYYPSASDVIEIYMRSNIVSEKMEYTVEDNYLHWTWTPSSTGCFGIEVFITQANGNKLRSYRRHQIKVVNCNEDIPTDDGQVEFVTEYIALDAATIFYAKGDTGNGISSIELYQTAGLIDTYVIHYTESEDTYFNVTNGDDAHISQEQIDDIVYQVEVDINPILDVKVDKVEGKGLSTNDYTTAEKDKLAGLSNYDDTDVRTLISNTNANFSNYYTKSQTYSSTQIDTMLRTQREGRYVVADSLPTASSETMFAIYLVPSEHSSTNNVKDEYVTVQSGGSYAWELIGSTYVDLSGYSTTTEMNAAISTALSSYYTKTQTDSLLSGKQNTISDLSTIRSGAEAGATAYQKPSGGIPSSDLTSAVQTSLGKADTALQSFTEQDPIFTASAAHNITSTDISNWNAKSDFSGSYNDLTNKPTIPTVNDATLTVQKEGVSVGTFTANDADNVTVNIVETDPVFVASAAHGITSSDITNWNNSPVLGDDDGTASDPDFDAYTDTVWHTAQTLSAAQKLQARTNISAQEALVSGTNIKTINNTSLLGSGNITIEGGGSGTIDSALDTTSTNAVQNAVIATALNGKVGSSTITTIVSISQSDYDALASKDSATLYVITS